MVLLTPALRALKSAYPEARLTLLLRPRVAALMETHPYLDACIVDEKKAGRWRSLLRLVKHIRENAYDLAVVLHPTSFRNALLPFLARIPVRIGTNSGGRGMLLTASCTDDTNCHEVHRYLRVVKCLGICPTSDALEFWHTDRDRESVDTLLRTEGVAPNDPLLAVNLGTTWETKRWPPHRFAEVLQQIAGTARVVLIGSAAEVSLVSALPAALPVINLVGKTTILELGALLEKCGACLTADSGPMHIAAAVGTPTVALFGPTDPTRHQPYGTGHRVIEKPISCRPCYKRRCARRDVPHLCMVDIRVPEVLAAVRNMGTEKRKNE